jgi:hypothetical protein
MIGISTGAKRSISQKHSIKLGSFLKEKLTIIVTTMKFAEKTSSPRTSNVIKRPLKGRAKLRRQWDMTIYHLLIVSQANTPFS